MTRGYFTIAQGVEYHRLAYGLALSLLKSQKTDWKLSIGVSAEEKELLEDSYYRPLFDQIIAVPWLDSAHASKRKFENWWKAIYMTPYDETICLDADMLFLEDISGTWDIMGESPSAFCTKPITYRGEIITSDYYRKTFTESGLPNVYAAFFYFKKNEKTSYEFFNLCEIIFNNWERFNYEFLKPLHRPTEFSTDVAFGIAAKILEFDRHYHHSALLNIPTFVHMKSHLQGWDEKKIVGGEDWTSMIPVYFGTDCDLKIGNFRQSAPFHYYVKSFLSDEKISILEKGVGRT